MPDSLFHIRLSLGEAESRKQNLEKQGYRAFLKPHKPYNSAPPKVVKDLNLWDVWGTTKKQTFFLAKRKVKKIVEEPKLNQLKEIKKEYGKSNDPATANIRS